MEIRDYRTGDEKHILSLFEIVFGKPMKPEYWKWRFNDNPAGKHMIKLMWEGEQLIGHYAVSPVFLKIGMSKMLSTLSMTTMTHPSFGGLGIFGQLANALYDDLENKMNVKAIWGYPNNNSHYGFIKNLKWLDLGQQLHLIIKAEKIKPALDPDINMFEDFSSIHGEAISKATDQFQVAVVRDESYLNWRYRDNPTSTYDKFEYKQNNEVLGFMVVKKYPSSINKEIYDLYITEIGFPKENGLLLSTFLKHIVAYYGQPEAIINTWISLFDNRFSLFEKAGFEPGGKSTFVGVRTNPEFRDILSDFRNWYFSYGDSDVY